MTAPLMPKATAVWLVENTTLTFKQIGDFCELHELEIQAIADGDVASNIVGMNPITFGQLTAEEVARCEGDKYASLIAIEPERNVKARNSKNKKVLSPSQRSDKPSAILWVLRNCPEIIDSQICKLIGTTKPTIATLKNGTHRDMVSLRPKNPVAVGLCKEKDLEEAIAISKKWTEPKKKKPTKKKSVKKTKAKAKVAAVKKDAKKTVKKAVKKVVKAASSKVKKSTIKKIVAKTKTETAKKTKIATKKTSVKKETVKKAAPKKVTAKKAIVKKETVVKKAVVKKAPVKKAATKKAAKK